MSLSSDSQTLVEVFVSQRRTLIGMLARIVGNSQTAEDLAQDAYMRVASAARDQPILALKAFLFRTARNLAFDHLRAERRHGSVVSQGLDQGALESVPAALPSPETQAFDRQRLALLDVAIGDMKDRRRTILVLHKLHGWDYARIAGHLGISESAVQKNVKLALADCLAALQENPKRRIDTT